MDRVHRLGQYRPMRCVRFVLGGTIEERILKLQVRERDETAGVDARVCVAVPPPGGGQYLHQG